MPERKDIGVVVESVAEKNHLVISGLNGAHDYIRWLYNHRIEADADGVPVLLQLFGGVHQKAHFWNDNVEFKSHFAFLYYFGADTVFANFPARLIKSGGSEFDVKKAVRKNSVV